MNFEKIDEAIQNAEKRFDLQTMEDILRCLHERCDYIIRRLPYVAHKKKENEF